MSSSNCGDFFSWFEVVYGGENHPHDCINEINGKSADINKGFGGEYVWLRAKRATAPKMMVDNLWTHIGDERAGQDDLSKGAGGKYRYFLWSDDMSKERYVTDVALWRSDDKQWQAPVGWEGKSGDINEGRGGDYLYLVWKTKVYSSSK